MKMILVNIFTAFCTVLPLLVAGYLKKVCEKKEARSMMLEMRWRHARTIRENWKKKWKKDHPYNTFDFNNTHYQWLYNIEISAEDLYLLSVDGRGCVISWNDWLYERELAMNNE
jgi:hypothetical protein